MNTELRLAEARDLGELQPLVRAYHAFENIQSSETERESALRRLVSDRTPGDIWLIFADGTLAGYIALCRGFSIEFNGFDAFIDQFFLEVTRNNHRARKLYAAAGFVARDKYLLMSAALEEK